MKNKIDNLLKNLSNSLLQYAQLRDIEKLVGQFWDEEGISEAQYGIYGMSSWLILSSDLSFQNISAEQLARYDHLINNCKLKLASWILIDNPAENENNLKQIVELKTVIPKICFAYFALSKCNDCDRPKTILLERLRRGFIDSQGSWGELINSPFGSPVVTAMVLRCVINDHNISREIIESAINYLLMHVEDTENTYLQLYIYNTLILLPTLKVNNRKNVEHKIKFCIKSLHSKVYYNPVQFPNPTNVDYHDNGRTRYFRLPSDIILLESLILLSPYNLLFIQTLVGYKVFMSLNKNIDGNLFKNDTSGHRAGGGYYVYAKSVIKTMSDVPKIKSNILIKIWSWYKYSYTFGLDFSWNVLIFYGSLTVSLFFHYYGYDWLRNIFFGIFIKTVLDAFKSLYNLSKTKIEP
ncbi:MAG: hypothetical protein WDA22_01485 [Bacteroidota bacterium]